MVQMRESTYTYLPFIYFYLISTAISLVYHNENQYLVRHRPYTVLVFLLINTAANRYYKTKSIIRNILHKHTWKAVTLAVYGILGNLVHEMVFHYNHFDGITYNNHIWSALYVTAVVILGYWYRNDELLMLANIVFLFVPINRTWQVNLHVYTIYITLSIYMMYSMCTKTTKMDTQLQKLPLVRYFAYLRVQDNFIMVGVVQLGLEYYMRYVPDSKTVAEIDAALTFDPKDGDDDDEIEP